MARKDENLSPEEEQLKQLKEDQKAFKREQKNQKKEAKKRAKDSVYYRDMAWYFVPVSEDGCGRLWLQCPYTDIKGCARYQ